MSKDNVDFELMFKLIKENNNEIKATRNEMREGFASMRAHNNAFHSDINVLQSRLDSLEINVERLNKAQGINTDTES